jgi:hypothetical protein
VVGASSMRSAVAWVWISRSRSAAIASATAARCSATASLERSDSSSSLRVSEGASLPPTRGCTGPSSAGGFVVGGMRPEPTRAAMGMRHPDGVATAPRSSRSSRLRRIVDTETPHAFAAAASPSTGPPAEGCVPPSTVSVGGISVEGAVILPTVTAIIRSSWLRHRATPR